MKDLGVGLLKSRGCLKLCDEMINEGFEIQKGLRGRLRRLMALFRI